MGSSVLLSLLALLPKILLTSALTFLCLWLAKSWFVFLRGFYMVSGRGRERGQAMRREGRKEG